MEQERRNFVRRVSDRDMLNQVQHLREQASGEMNRELRHKRRRAIRHRCNVQLSIPMGHKDAHSNDWNMSSQPIGGKLLDLSVDGCQVFARNLLEIGAVLSLLITLEGGQDIKAVGMVRWTKGIPEKEGFALGIQFTRAAHHAQRSIQEFLTRLDQTVGL